MWAPTSAGIVQQQPELSWQQFGRSEFIGGVQAG
jgi:hypothetical protein